MCGFMRKPILNSSDEQKLILTAIEHQTMSVRIGIHIISNFIPRETIIYEDSCKKKKSYMKKNQEHKKYINNKSNFLFLQNINNLQAQIKTLIDISKPNYFSRISEKLESTSINTKCYWFLLKTFLNNKKNPTYSTIVPQW